MDPTAREALADGDRIADHELEEHAEAKKVMKDLDGLDPSDSKFDQLLVKPMEDIRHHVGEEDDLLPKPQSACTQEQLNDLGEKVLKAKEMAPTRPHPSAPDTPPANKILGPGAGLVDKMRDRLSGRST